MIGPEEFENDGFHGPLLTAYHHLRYLTAQLPSSKPSPLPTLPTGSPRVPHEVFLFLRSSLAINLHSFNSSHLLSPDTQPGTIYDFEAHKLAAQIYFQLVLYDLRPTHPRVQCLKTALISTISNAEGPHPCLEPRRKTALWVFFMGALTSNNGLEMRWFAERIARTMCRLGCYNWEDVEEVLRSVAWKEELMDLREGMGRRMWRSVEVVRERGLEKSLPVFSTDVFPRTKTGLGAEVEKEWVGCGAG